MFRARRHRTLVAVTLAAAFAAAAPGRAAKAIDGSPGRPPAWGALNVFDFGAVGDGVADDAPALAAAISAAVARGVGVVVVPKKLWIRSPVNSLTSPGASAATPLTYVIPRGGGLHVTRVGLELVLHGNVEAGPYQWLFGERARWVGSTIFANSGPGRPEWYGAVADGVTNDEPAISTALALHGDVLFQSKTYAVAARSAPSWSGSTHYAIGAEVEYQGNLYRSLQGSNVGQRPDGAPKWWLPAPIFPYDAKRVSGQRSWREDQGGTVISVIAGGAGRPGGVFGCRSNAGELRDLTILANGRARAGVWLDTSYGAHVENVSVQGATEAGFRFKTAQVSVFRRLFATKNQVGFWIEDGNAARYYDLKAAQNVAEGIRIEAVAMSGGVSIYGADLETNNTGRRSAGLVVKNTTSPVELASLWLEEDGGDAIQLDNARFVTLFGSRISGMGDAGSTYRAIRLKRGSRGNTLVACKLVSGNGDARYEQIEIEPGSMENSVFGCVRMSQSAGSSAYPARVAYRDRNTVASNHVAWAGAVPAGGYWAAGDVVWNNSADTAVLGWRCVESGTPGVWRPLASRAAATSDSAATDVEALRRDFNHLLRRLQDAGLMEPNRAR